MRYHTNIEQIAVHNAGVFVLGDGVGGRLTWPTPSSGSERHYYRAELLEDPGIWEIGVGDCDGSVLTKSVGLANAGWSLISADALVRVAQIAPASAAWAVDASVASDALPSALANGGASMAAGVGAQAWGDEAIAIGLSAKVGDSSDSFFSGVAIGSNAEVRHFNAMALGYYSRTLTNGGVHNFDCGLWWAGRANSEGDEPVQLAGSSFGPIALPPDALIALTGTVTARRVDGAGSYAVEVKVAVSCSSSGVASIVGTPGVTVIGQSGATGLSVAVVVDGESGAVGIECTGAASQSWVWTGSFVGSWA